MKVMKYFAVASLALFAACNNEENPVAPESGNQPVDVVMSVALPGPGTRAAMGELQNTANDQDAASVEKLHVYLVAGEDIVLSKEFTKDTDDFTKLTSATAVGAEATTGGYKFLDVDNGVTKALVIANPQGALVDGERKTVAEISKQQLKAQINEVIYAGSETLTTVGAEPYGVNPQEDKRTVKKAELTLTASMNRFQVTGTKFVKVIWKDGKKTYAGDRYKFEDGTFKPDGSTDLSEVASYFNAAGFDFAQGAKAAAFNFFVNGITGYGKENNAPKLAFVFKTGDDGVSADRRFVVISGYAKAEGETAGTTDLEAGKGGYLINLDLAALNGGQGILVDVDPSIPEGVTPEPGGQGDLEDENVNVIVRVEVQPWTAVNVFPILD